MTETQEAQKIEEFRNLWWRDKSYLSLTLTNQEIKFYVSRYGIEKAVDLAADYLLSQGLCDVQE